MSRKRELNTQELHAQAGTPVPLYLGLYLSERSPLPLLAVEGVNHLVRYANPAFCHLVGKEKDDLFAKPFAVAMPEGQVREGLELLNRVYRTGEADSLAAQEQRHATSETRFWSYTAWAIRDENEQTSGVMLEVRDTIQQVLLSQQNQKVSRETQSAIAPSTATEEPASPNNRHAFPVESTQNTVEENLLRAQEAMVVCLSRLVELRDEETQEHSIRVTEMMVKLAHAMEMTAEEALLTKWGGLLHDIGKTGIPDAILHKPGALNDQERAIMQRHPALASQMLSALPFLVGPAIDIPLYHHEKWDGSGYPYGLKGEAIPLPARLFAVVDVYDALLSDRPYRKAWTEHEARQYLLAKTGTHFDPVAVAAFLALLAAQEKNPTDSL